MVLLGRRPSQGVPGKGGATGGREGLPGLRGLRKVGLHDRAHRVAACPGGAPLVACRQPPLGPLAATCEQMQASR